MTSTVCSARNVARLFKKPAKRLSYMHTWLRPRSEHLRGLSTLPAASTDLEVNNYEGIQTRFHTVFTPPCFTRDRAKEEAHKALISDATQGLPLWDLTSSTFSLTRPQLIHKNAIPPGVGKSIHELDTALPGKHTKALYDSLSKRDARILVQLRTGCARLNQFLARIKASSLLHANAVRRQSHLATTYSAILFDTQR